MIDFAIPGLFTHNTMLRILYDMWKEEPEYFNDVKINAVYGIFPFCIWDGGRIFPKYSHASYEDIEKTVNEINSREISVRLILTNNQLKEQDYYDHFGNLMLKLCENERNQIVVGDDKFRDYIKANYPKYNFISSTTKCITNSRDFISELDKEEYSQICLDYNLNHNFKMLDELNQEQKDKCEFLVNAICPPGCPSRKEHYKLNSIFSLTYGKNYVTPKCGITNDTLHPLTKNYVNNITYDNIVKDYMSRGFTHFKLEGRTFDNSELAGNLMNYLVKPEAQLYIYHKLLKLTELETNKR